MIGVQVMSPGPTGILTGQLRQDWPLTGLAVMPGIDEKNHRTSDVSWPWRCDLSYAWGCAGRRAQISPGGARRWVQICAQVRPRPLPWRSSMIVWLSFSWTAEMGSATRFGVVAAGTAQANDIWPP